MHPEHRFAAMLHDIKQRLRARRMVRRQGSDAVIADLAGFKGLHGMDDRRAVGGTLAVFRLDIRHARAFLLRQLGRHIQMPGIVVLVAGGHLRSGIVIRMPVRNQDMAIPAHIQAVERLMRKHIGGAVDHNIVNGCLRTGADILAAVRAGIAAQPAGTKRLRNAIAVAGAIIGNFHIAALPYFHSRAIITCPRAKSQPWGSTIDQKL